MKDLYTYKTQADSLQWQHVNKDCNNNNNNERISRAPFQLSTKEKKKITHKTNIPYQRTQK